ncbi:MAG: YARHG domain-containing protein [Salinivirgaceae bacterium]|jgi:hypothetical protein|nr:YARHG domain-containing protein [Salinivirgaceae bacterium]
MKKYLVLILSLLALSVHSQKVANYNYDAFSFIGFVDNIPVFVCNPLSQYDYSINEKPGNLYIAEANNGMITFTLYREVDRKLEGDALFIKDECIGYDSYFGGQILTMHCDNKINKFEFEEDVFYSSFAVSVKNELLISPTDEKSARLEYFHKNKLSYERIKLPIIGNFPICVGDYAYFSTYHINPEYTHYPLDIYKVKIGDWNNPELLLEEAVETWMPIPNTEIIYTRISIDGHLQNVYYNTSNKTYKITNDQFNPQIIKYDDEYKILNTCKDDATGNSRYCLKELPDFNNEVFTTIDNRVISDNLVMVNLSNNEKPFANTFITENLLYSTESKELKKLDKEQLRILRNAFFARQGYKFKSNDLQEFFGQFEWYNQMLQSYKVLEITNEDVVISPKDKDRVALIKEMETQK